MLFEGVRGASFRGDIAIDDFKLMDGACNQPGYCDFEKVDWCTWVNADREDTFDWLVGSGSTPSSHTGPSTDHTTGLLIVPQFSVNGLLFIYGNLVYQRS